MVSFLYGSKMSADKPNMRTSKNNKLSPSGLTSAEKSIKPPTLVPPVLREVGKLAASVASVSTNALSTGLTPRSAVLSSGSATGSPRNKCALQPGHSLMDWIRLGASGKDLTGLGSGAGTLSVTKQELAKHNKKDDAWLAIRGRVYNVTHYLPFHPGGEDELMKGVGKDATQLFNEVHAWVNYEQILQKCVIGRLVTLDPSLNPEDLFSGKINKTESTNSNSSNIVASPTNSTTDNSTINRVDSASDTNQTLDEALALPRFDWIQKLDFITVIFYTKSFCNPLVEVQQPKDDKAVNIFITYEDTMFKNELVFLEKVRWPCDITITIETGKVEMVFRKAVSGIWNNYGVLKQQSKVTSSISAAHVKSNYVLKKKENITHDIYLLQFERTDGGRMVVPIGKHVRVFGTVNGEEMSRAYTPVPNNLFLYTKFATHNSTKDSLCLMIKRYPDGKISKYVTDRNENDLLQISRPLGSFQLKVLEKRETFLMLAAGTGITPMLGLALFLLERRIKKSQFIHLLFFNKAEEDIPFRKQFDELADEDPRFRIDHVLSEPSISWRGMTGRVNEQMVTNALQEHLQDTGYSIKDIYAFVCGSPGFNDASTGVLQNVGLLPDQYHVFRG